MKVRRFKNRCEIASPAKVNLFLELPARRNDGFHEIETVMSSVGIYDQLQFEIDASQPGLQVEVVKVGVGTRPQDCDLIPSDETNLIIKTLQKIRSVAREENGNDSCQSGIKVRLLKRIPSAAGLGGASGNSAAALIAANFLWELRWSRERLMNISSELGSDIPFFLFGGTCLCTGRGERIEPIADLSGQAIVVAQPPEPLSTAHVFSQVSIASNQIGSDQIIKVIRTGERNRVANHLFNRLQEFAEPLTPYISTICNAFREISTCLGCLMTGSGSGCFGLFPDQRTARQAANVLSVRHPKVRIFCSKLLSSLPC